MQNNHQPNSPHAEPLNQEQTAWLNDFVQYAKSTCRGKLLNVFIKTTPAGTTMQEGPITAIVVVDDIDIQRQIEIRKHGIETGKEKLGESPTVIVRHTSVWKNQTGLKKFSDLIQIV